MITNPMAQANGSQKGTPKREAFPHVFCLPMSPKITSIKRRSSFLWCFIRRIIKEKTMMRIVRNSSVGRRYV